VRVRAGIVVLATTPELSLTRTSVHVTAAAAIIAAAAIPTLEPL
jgi:hypothetical protein